MSPKKFERINGLTPACGDGLWTVSYCGKRLEHKDLSKLADAVLAINRTIVIMEQRYRCAACDGLKPLSGHHKTHRKMGGGSRNDRIENLEGLCSDCHGKEHGQTIKRH